MAVISGTQGYWRVSLTVNEASTDVNTNTSVANWSLSISRTDSGNYPMYGTPHIVIWISGVKVYDASVYRALGSVTSAGVTLESGTLRNIEHNDDGTIKNNGASFSWSGSGFSPNNVSGSGSYSTSTIARASTATATSVYVGEVSRVEVTRKSSSFSHAIKIYFGNWEGFLLADGSVTNTYTKITATSINFKTPTAWYAQMPNESSKQAIIDIETWNGNNLVGSYKRDYFTVRVDANNSRPVVTSSVVDTNNTTIALTGNSNKLIKDYSSARVTYSATPRNSATISNITINGTRVTSSPVTIGVSSGSIKVIATDSRGFPTESNPSFTYIDYNRPTINLLAKRENPTSNYVMLKFDGTWFNGSFGATSNNLDISWRYKETGSSSWGTTYGLTKDTHYKISGNKFYSGSGSSASEIKLGNDSLDYNKSWDIDIIVRDKLAGSLETVDRIPRGKPTFWFNDTTLYSENRVGWNVEPNGGDGQNGYIKFLTLTIIGPWADHPIHLKIAQRGRQTFNVDICPANSSSVDPSYLNYVCTDGATVYFRKSGTSKWEFYLEKTEGYDHIMVLDANKNPVYEGSNYTIDTTGGFVSSLPSDCMKSEYNTGNDIYNSLETIIGSWYGKPLYRKVVPYEGDFFEHPIPTGITNMNWCVRISGVAKLVNTNVTIPLPFYNGNGWDSFHLIDNGANIYCQRGSLYEVTGAYFIIEYTKTTD